MEVIAKVREVLAEVLAKVCGSKRKFSQKLAEVLAEGLSKVSGLAISRLEKISRCPPLLLSNTVGQISGPAYPARRSPLQYCTWEYLYLLANFQTAHYVYRPSLYDCLYIAGHISGCVISWNRLAAIWRTSEFLKYSGWICQYPSNFPHNKKGDDVNIRYWRKQVLSIRVFTLPSYLGYSLWYM